MKNKIIVAAQKIIDGDLVIFPTETVYGIGADATNEEAVSKIFTIKKRPKINPLIVHVSSLRDAESIGIFNQYAYKLAEHLWPGPLTIVVYLKNYTNIAKSVVAGLNSVAIRIPSHSTALSLIDMCGPIAAPSANPSGYISSTRFEHVSEYFNDIYILPQNDVLYGLESTIIDTTQNIPTILRLGYITQSTIEEVLNVKCMINNSESIKAPGMFTKHYAPITSIRLEAASAYHNELGLNFGCSKLDTVYSLNLSKNSNLNEATYNLYDMMRILDKYAQAHNIKSIAIANIPKIGLGLSINDRLSRAAKL